MIRNWISWSRMGRKAVATASLGALILTGALANTRIAGPNEGAPARTAREVQKLFEGRYRHASTLKAIFYERYSSGKQTGEAESGTVYFSRPGRMRWEYESPAKKLFIVDGKNVWFYIPADHTASRATMKNSSDRQEIRDRAIAAIEGSTGRDGIGQGHRAVPQALYPQSRIYGRSSDRRPAPQ